MLRFEHAKLDTWPEEAVFFMQDDLQTSSTDDSSPLRRVHRHAAATTRALSLQFNYLTSVPCKALACFPDLTYLALGGNELTSVPNLSFVPNLRYLHLNNNKIESMAGLGKEMVPNLEVLDMRGNLIRVLECALLPISLRRLSLACNLLESIRDWEALAESGGLPHLEFLSLYANRLADASAMAALVENAPALHRLLLGGNPGWRTHVGGGGGGADSSGSSGSTGSSSSSISSSRGRGRGSSSRGREVGVGGGVEEKEVRPLPPLSRKRAGVKRNAFAALEALVVTLPEHLEFLDGAYRWTS